MWQQKRTLEPRELSSIPGTGKKKKKKRKWLIQGHKCWSGIQAFSFLCWLYYLEFHDTHVMDEAPGYSPHHPGASDMTLLPSRDHRVSLYSQLACNSRSSCLQRSGITACLLRLCGVCHSCCWGTIVLPHRVPHQCRWKLSCKVRELATTGHLVASWISPCLKLMKPWMFLLHGSTPFLFPSS